MHPRYHRRLPHAERAQLWRRQATATKAIGEESETSTASFILTTPITLTIIQTIRDSTSTSVSSTSISTIVKPTSSSTSSSSTAQSTSSTSSSSSISQTSLVTSTGSSSSSLSPASSTVSSSGTLSGTNSSTPSAVGSLSSSTNELPGGAIAAIVIVVIISFVGGILYLMRSKSRRTRMKLRPLWTQSKALNKPVGISSATYPFEPVESAYPATETRQVPSRTSGLSISIPAASVSVPPTSYNSDSNSSISANIVSATSTLPPTLAVYSPGAKSAPSPFSAVVSSSFITRLPDELSIAVGERLRVLAEYDDGWSLCMNSTGEQGMVPNECLNRGGGLSQRPTMAQAATQSAERRSSRVSSVGWS
ncbi:hypothetical protein JR316_0003918 [Psilocybe cubensis]|uniref:Uncharacterized protein n=2 Tax=Psilocybe cubensis TaxID=181762 RepID=A0ACB8HAC9_PSICU|nr:hypothetical protein JR316_0003918 [Psilocybe cubensis]KAH9484436.1 hypothetical protein JR316_0003918 [Psilocybe cubensis]